MAKASAGRTVKTVAPDDMPRPTHIVLFRNETESSVNAEVVSQALGAEPVNALSSILGIDEFAGRSDGAHATVYRALGVAAVSGNPEEIARLAADPHVEEVFVNEERHIPTPVTAATITVAGAAPAPGLDYLYGLRDGLEIAIGSMTGSRRALPGTAPSQTSSPVYGGSTTWGLQAIGHTPGSKWTGKGISVAVLDTGIDLNHPDFVGRVSDGTTARSFIPGQGVQDGHGHGTHCCGTVVGPRQSVGGIRYGVAPEATLLVGKVLSNQGRGWDDQIVDGIQWAVAMGARVISMSLGSSRGLNKPFNRLYERVAERLLEGRPGTLVVAAAGNDSARPFSTAPVNDPAASPSILAVAAVDQALAVASFSCRQMDGVGAVDVAAPGVRVYSAVPGGRFAELNGTSQATPHVAGAAALHFEADPGLTARAAWDRIVANAKPLGDPADFGSGLVQVPVG